MNTRLIEARILFGPRQAVGIGVLIRMRLIKSVKDNSYRCMRLIFIFSKKTILTLMEAIANVIIVCGRNKVELSHCREV